MLKGEIISLHAVEKTDIGQLKNWRNNSEYRKYPAPKNRVNKTIWIKRINLSKLN